MTDPRLLPIREELEQIARKAERADSEPGVVQVQTLRGIRADAMALARRLELVPRPCPFCGKAGVPPNSDIWPAWVRCESTLCCAHGPARDSIRNAVLAWNATGLEKEGGGG